MNTPPKDICRYITVFLSLRDCYNLFLLNKHWNQLARDGRFWQKRLKLDFDCVEQQATLCLQLYKQEMAILRQVKAPGPTMPYEFEQLTDLCGSYNVGKFVDSTVCLNLPWNGQLGKTCPDWESILTSVLRSDLKLKNLIIDVLKWLGHHSTHFNSNLVLTDITFSPGLRLINVNVNSNETLTLFVDRIYDRILSNGKTATSPHKSKNTSLISAVKYLVIPTAILVLLGLSYFGSKKYSDTRQVEL